MKDLSSTEFLNFPARNALSNALIFLFLEEEGITVYFTILLKINFTEAIILLTYVTEDFCLRNV